MEKDTWSKSYIYIIIYIYIYWNGIEEKTGSHPQAPTPTSEDARLAGALSSWRGQEIESI